MEPRQEQTNETATVEGQTIPSVVSASQLGLDNRKNNRESTKEPSKQIKTGVRICVISIILIVIDSFIGLGKGEADSHFNDSAAGQATKAIYFVLSLLFVLGLVLIVIGVVRRIGNRNAS